MPGPGVLQVFLRAETPQHGGAVHARVAGRLHVHVAVAHIESVTLGAAKFLHHMQHRVRLRLAADALPLAHGQRNAGEIILAQGFDVGVVLVGDYRQLEALFLQRVDQLGNARIGRGGIVIVEKVVPLEGLQRHFVGLRVRVAFRRQRPADQHPDAIAHEALHVLHGMLRVSALPQRLIGGVGQILQRIQQCSVQIKDHSGIALHQNIPFCPAFHDKSPGVPELCPFFQQADILSPFSEKILPYFFMRESRRPRPAPAR